MKKIILIAAAVVFLASCKKDTGSYTSSAQSELASKKYADIATNALLSYKGADDEVNASHRSKKKVVTKPLISAGSGTIAYVPNGCGDGTLQLLSTGAGHSTELGKFTQSTTICINGLTGEVIGSVIGVGKAANGDELIYTFIGAGIEPRTGYTYQNYTITGGTGRFMNATGSLTLLYYINTPTNYSYVGKGSVTY